MVRARGAGSAAALVLFILACILALPAPAAAKPQPQVVVSFEEVPASAAVGATVDLVVRLTASAAAGDVDAEVLPSPDVRIVSGATQWAGALAAGEILDLPLAVQFIGSGEYALGVRVTNRRPGGTQTSGASLNVITYGGVVALSADPHFLMKLPQARGPADLVQLGIAAPTAGPPALAPGLAAAVGSVNGTVRWQDPEGNLHLVRGALVQVFDGAPGGTLLAETLTDAAGAYFASVSAASGQVSVRVFSQDGFGGAFVVVFPPGQAASRYILEKGPVALNGSVTLDIDSARPQRGTPGNQTGAAEGQAGLNARAFAVFDAMVVYWVQATALLGRNMPTALTQFPNGAASGHCTTISCYSALNMYILREDAFDWDVIGHEFFHFTTDVFSQGGRQIDNSPGGFHSGGSAIGQGPGPGGSGTPRTRDEGMRLAWSEGLATFMSLALQRQPLPSVVPFPTPLLNVSDTAYTDTEDAGGVPDPAETPTPNEGFGSEESVIGLLWDLFDGVQDADGAVTDTIAGAGPQLIWNLITAILPCNPCDRVDRFWESIVSLLGPFSPGLFPIVNAFVINQMAPKALAPDNVPIPGGIPPTFQWIPRGDPSAAHRNDTFFLVFSRDNFQAHRVLISVPGTGLTSYTPTQAEWDQVVLGGQNLSQYKWFVAATRGDAPIIPEGWFWYSNTLTFSVRSLHIRITWDKLGADVDLHLSPPSGSDIAYYNRTPGWGVLDRDCITTCTEENISLISFPQTGIYRAFAHYYSDHGKGPTLVHAQVFNAGAPALDTFFLLSATGQEQDIFSIFLVASSRPGEFDIRLVPGSGVPSTGPDLRELPPKPDAGP